MIIDLVEYKNGLPSVLLEQIGDPRNCYQSGGLVLDLTELHTTQALVGMFQRHRYSIIDFLIFRIARDFHLLDATVPFFGLNRKS